MRTRHHNPIAMVISFAFLAVVIWYNMDRPSDSSPKTAENKPVPEKQESPASDPPPTPAPAPPSAPESPTVTAPSVQSPNPTPPPLSAKRDFENPLAPSSLPSEPGLRSAEDDPTAAPEFGKIFLMLRDFRTTTGENPVGTNAEIMKALMGDNPRGAKFGPPEGMALNGEGELIDPWGSPYFFHQVSRDVMEIISAGPDQRRGTEDDLISR